MWTQSHWRMQWPLCICSSMNIHLCARINWSHSWCYAYMVTLSKNWNKNSDAAIDVQSNFCHFQIGRASVINLFILWGNVSETNAHRNVSDKKRATGLDRRLRKWYMHLHRKQANAPTILKTYVIFGCSLAAAVYCCVYVQFFFALSLIALCSLTLLCHCFRNLFRIQW